MKTLALSIRKWLADRWKQAGVRSELIDKGYTKKLYSKLGWFLLGWFVGLTLVLGFALSSFVGLMAFRDGFLAYGIVVGIATAVLTFLPCVLIAIDFDRDLVVHWLIYLIIGAIGAAVTSIVILAIGVVERTGNEFGRQPSMTPALAATWVIGVGVFCALAALSIYSLNYLKEGAKEAKKTLPELIQL
jgi:hypothetical protein